MNHYHYEACETDPDAGEVARVIGSGRTEQDARCYAALEFDLTDRCERAENLHVRRAQS